MLLPPWALAPAPAPPQLPSLLVAAGLLQLHMQGGHLLPQLCFLGPALRQPCAVGLRGSVVGLEDTERGQGRGPTSHGPLYHWDTAVDLRALSEIGPREVPLGGGKISLP